MRSVKAQTIWKTLDWVRLGENENVLPVQGTWQRWIQFKYLNHVLIEICRAWQLKPSPIQKQKGNARHMQMFGTLKTAKYDFYLQKRV